MRGEMKAHSSDGRLTNGLLLNGVWKDYYDIIVTASESERLAEERIAFLMEDRDSMAIERFNLLQQWFINISSLTTVETNHLEAKQIIDQIRSEKEGLESRCSALEAQRDWLERQRRELRGQLTTMSATADLQRIELAEGENQLVLEKNENKCLLELTYKRDETIDALLNRITRSDEEVEILSKSLSTKDRQFQTLLKERNRLKEELETSTKELARQKKFRLSLQMSNSGTSTSPLSAPRGQTPHLYQRAPGPGRRPITGSPSSPEQYTDDELHTSLFESDDAQSPSPSFGTPPSFNKGSATKNCIASVSRNLSMTDYQSSPHDVAVQLPDAEPNIGVRDKIYRSIIKKLQNELTAARNQLNEKPSARSNSFRVPCK